MDMVTLAVLGGLFLVGFGAYRIVEMGVEYFRIKRIKELVASRQLPPTAYDPYKEMDFADVVKAWFITFMGFLSVLAGQGAVIKQNGVLAGGASDTVLVAQAEVMRHLVFSTFALRIASVMMAFVGLFGVIEILWIYGQRLGG